MALLNEVAAAPSATHAAGQYGEGGNILTQQALTQPGAHAAFRAPFVAAPHPGVPPMFAPYGVYGGGAGSLGPTGVEWPRWSAHVQPPAAQPAGGAGGAVAPVDAKRPWGPRLGPNEPPPDPTHAAAGSGSSGGNVLSGGGNVLSGGGGSLGGGSLGGGSLGGSGASENTFDSYGRPAPPGMALYAAAYPGGYPGAGPRPAPWTHQPAGYPNAPAGYPNAPAAYAPPPKRIPSGFLVDASAAHATQEKKEPSPGSGGTTLTGARTNGVSGGGERATTNGTTRGADAIEPRARAANLVHVQSSAAAAPASAHNPLATRTKSLLGERTFAEVQTMLLRQQGTYERQLLDLHRVVHTQSDIICSITKQDGVDFKSEQDAARGEKSKSPDSNQSKELKLNKSEQGSGAGSGDGSGQGSGGGSEGGSGDDGSGQGSKGSGPDVGDGSGHGSGGDGGSGQGSGSGGSDVSDGDKGPRRPILKGRRSPRGGANENKNKRATISPEVDKIERLSSRTKDSRGDQEEEERAAKKDSRGDSRARSARAAAAPEAAPRDEAEEGGARAAPRDAKPNDEGPDATNTSSDPNNNKAGPGASEGPFAAIVSAMAHHAVIKQAAQKAFDEQSLHQQRAYALATRPWREEGGGDHRPGDNAAPPSHHQRQHQAAAAVHHAQVQAAYHASRQRSLQSLHQQQQQHEQRYYHDQWVAWYSQQYAHAAAAAAAAQGACAPGSMGPPQPKPPPGVAGLGWTNWAAPGDWFQMTGPRPPPRGEEVTQVIGGPSHHHATPGPHAMAARHHYHFPVPQPPGAMYPHPAFPGSGSQGPPPGAGYPGALNPSGGSGGGKSPAAGAAEDARGANAGQQRGGDDDTLKSGARDAHKKGSNDNNANNNANKGKRGKGTKRGAGGGRKSADGKTEDIDDAGSDSMMTGQPCQSDGGEVDGHHGGRGGGGVGGARGNGTNKKGSLIPGAPLTKKPRSGQPKQGPKDQSAADILISIMKA